MTPQLPAAAWAEAMAFALARIEAADDPRNHKLLEKGATSAWHQFKGRLGPQHLLTLLLEDAAVRRPIPFDVRQRLGTQARIEALSSDAVQAMLDGARGQDFQQPATDYLTAQAKRLGITTRLARAELHAVKANHQVLELPGTGGQLAAYLTAKHDLPFHAVFTIACANEAEVTLAGMAAIECRAAGTPRISLDPDLSLAKQRAYDFVIGLSPSKGGAFTESQLKGLGTTLVLV